MTANGATREAISIMAVDEYFGARRTDTRLTDMVENMIV